MKRVLTALVLIPLVLLAVFRAPDWLFTLLVGVVAVLATIEYLQIAAKYGYRVYPVVTCLLTVLIYLAGIVALSASESKIDVLVIGITSVILFGPFLLLAAGMRRENLKEVLPGTAVSFFAIPFIAISLLCLALIRTFPSGWFLILFTFFAVWVGDTAAYYVGRSIGKTKFAPRISPKKTWEGAIASVVGAVLVGVTFAYFAPRIDLRLLQHHVIYDPKFSIEPQEYQFSGLIVWKAAVAALAINIAAQLGDLFESLVKRGADVKDSGTMLPGHGGILDRIDALLFAAPVALVVFTLFGI